MKAPLKAPERPMASPALRTASAPARARGRMHAGARGARFVGLAGCAALLAAALAWAPAPAFADDISDKLDAVQAELAEKTAALKDLADTVEAESKRIRTIDAEMEALLDELAQKQADHARLQTDAASVATLMYKDGDDFNLLVLLERSGSLEEFLNRLAMREQILASSTEMLAQLRQSADDLNASYDEASKKKDEQNALIADAKKKQRELGATIAELQKREKQLSLEQKAALAQAAAKAHKVADTFATETGDGKTASTGGTGAAEGTGASGAPDAAVADESSDDDAREASKRRSGKSGKQGSSASGEDSPRADEAKAPADSPNGEQADASDGGDAEPDGASSADEPSPDAAQDDMQSEDEANTLTEGVASLKADGSAPDADGWRTGLASAYGGSSDASTPNPGTTAMGTRCDDWSVGVAVPIAWGPADYYGHYVEISYDGQSIIAPIVDCGNMGNGARALDLQPGVFKAFGAKTCNDWGVREVRYRFL